MTVTYGLWLPAPADWINANHRLHWRKKAALTAEWREAAGWLGKAHLADRPPMQRAHVVAELHFATNRRRDVGNYAPTVKAVIDGLVTDAGMLPDDNDTHMVGPDLRPGDPTFTFVGVRVIFTELPALAGRVSAHLRTENSSADQVRSGSPGHDRALGGAFDASADTAPTAPTGGAA